MNLEAIRPQDTLEGEGEIFEGEVNLGQVFYELNIADWIEMTGSGIKKTGKLEIGGRIGFIDPTKNIDSLIGKILTLSMEDNRFLKLKSGVHGTIIEAEFLQ